MPRTIRFITSALVAAAIIAGAVACGDGSDGSAGTTSTPGLQPTSASSPSATRTGTSPFATEFAGPNEGGQAPVFYRTADNFASVVAGQPYKVLFRITNGYAEPTLSVVAACTSCPRSATPQTSFTGTKTEPVGKEPPGSYYPVNLELPSAGHWDLLVRATPDDVTIPIDVQTAP